MKGALPRILSGVLELALLPIITLTLLWSRGPKNVCGAFSADACTFRVAFAAALLVTTFAAIRFTLERYPWTAFSLRSIALVVAFYAP